MAKPQKSIYPIPIYEATLSTGEVARLSFFSPANKPIDPERGRKAIEAFWCSDYTKPIWRRENNAWCCRYERRLDVFIEKGIVRWNGKIIEDDGKKLKARKVKSCPHCGKEI